MLDLETKEKKVFFCNHEIASKCYNKFDAMCKLIDEYFLLEHPVSITILKYNDFSRSLAITRMSEKYDLQCQELPYFVIFLKRG